MRILRRKLHDRTFFCQEMTQGAGKQARFHIEGSELSKSGDPAPSAADLQITHLLREAAKTIEIALLDHVIVGRAGADPLGRGYYSFRDANWPAC